MTTAPPKKCEFCDKRGVPILPLRYAVAPAGTKLPKADEPSVKLPESAAYYTRRVLRSGYLYVYDEARSRWDSYFVTPQAMFFKLASTSGMPPVLPQKPFDCPDDGHRAVASCITIPDAKNATNVWLGFSDAEWTPAVKKKHESASYRKRHMRCVNVKNFASSVDKIHTLGMHTVGEEVAEFAKDNKQLNQSIGYSPFEIESRQLQKERLLQECENLAPGKAFAVVLDDPVGLATELAVLMKFNHDLFVNNKEFKRGVAIDGVIEQMEMSIKQQGERSRMAKARQDAANAVDPGYMGSGDGGGAAAGGMALARSFNKRLDDSLTEMEEELRNVSAAELDAAANGAWARYDKKFSESARKTWRAKFEEQLLKYDEKFIAPLALAHTALLKHIDMQAYFGCNFDEEDVRSGAVYSATFANCIISTADKKSCFDLYAHWLQGDLTDTKNLLLQALTYHNKPLKEKITEAAQGGTDWGGLPWDKAIEAFDKATQSLKTGSPDSLGRLVGSITGPLAASLINAAKGQKIYAGLVALGAAARQPIVAVTIEGSKKAFRTMLIHEMIRLSGNPTAPNKMQYAVAEELRRLKIHGVPLDGSDTKRWLLMIDPDEVAAMPKNLSASARAQWLAKTIRTPAQVEALNLSRFQAKVSKATGTIRAGVPVAFGVLGIVANWVALDSVRDGERKAMQHTKGEGLVRIYAQGAQLIGAVASTIETTLAKMPAFSSAIGGGMIRFSAAAMRLVGKLGVIGSLFMVAIDVWRLHKEVKEDNYQGALAYGVSATLGAAATILLLLGSTGVGLILVAAMIIWSFVMTVLVDNSIQDWLERTLWGKLESQRYSSLEVELAELKTALN